MFRGDALKLLKLKLQWLRVSSPTKNAAGGQAHSSLLLTVNGLFVQTQVLLELIPHIKRRKGGSLPF